MTQAQTRDPAEVCQAFGIMFGLLDRLDEGRDDAVFFADKGGAWQVGVDWTQVLPAWFRVLSATTVPEEYAHRITGLLDHHYRYGSSRMLGVARKIATPAQRATLRRFLAGVRRPGVPGSASCSMNALGPVRHADR